MPNHKRSAKAKTKSKAWNRALPREKMPPPPPPPPPPSKKLVADVAESASALTLQEPGVSSSEVLIDTKSQEESFTTTPPAAPQNTIGSSSSTLLSNCEKLLIDFADSASTPALKEPDVSSYELIGSSSEESIIAGPQMLPYNTIDVSSSCENILEGAGDSICAPALQYPDVSSSDEFSDNSSEESISSPRTVRHNTTGGSLQSASSLGSSILVQRYVNCYQDFYIRMDRRGLFLTYPDVGGPFHSKDEAIHATKCFFDELWCERCKDDDEFSHVEGVVHDRKYYLRGPPKRTSSQSTYDGKRYLIKAILDQFNDDNNLVGNRAHELDDLLRKQIIYEKNTWYYHFNFTTKQKEDDDNSSNAKKVFFAEVVDVPERKSWVVTCCCMIDPRPDGYEGVPSLHDDVVCYGCTNNGSPSMMHPSDTGAYTAGRWNGYLPFSYDSGSDDDENVIDMYDLEDDDDEEEEEEEENEELKEAVREVLKAWPRPMFSPRVDRDLYALLIEG